MNKKILIHIVISIFLFLLFLFFSPIKSEVNAAKTFTKYALSDSQVRKLAGICMREQGTPKGAAAEASLMANLVELRDSYSDDAEGLWNYVFNSGWFGSYSRNANTPESSNAEAIQAVKNVLVKGMRTLPRYINEHDCFSDLTSPGTSDRSQYIKDVTVCRNVYGSVWTFYCFPTEVSDPFGYTAEAYAKFGGDDYCYDYDTWTLNGTSNGSSHKNTIGTLLIGLLSNICEYGGNAVQQGLDDLSTIWYSGEDDTYAETDIESNEEINEEIEVGDEEQTTGTGTISTIVLESSITNIFGEIEDVYTADTAIPVLPIDIYSMSIGKVDILDIDFYTSNSGNSNKIWKIFQKLISAVNKVVLYISAALLLTMAIIRSIILVMSIVKGQPESAANAKKSINVLFKAILVLTGMYLIMAGMVYFYGEIMSIITNGNDSNYLIRVVVKGVYSFNTNLIGIIKYKTAAGNVFIRFVYSLLYVIYAFIINAIWFIYMLIIRVLGLGLLTIGAPIVAVNYMKGQSVSLGKGTHMKSIFYFRNWFKLFMVLLWSPMLVVIIYRLMLIMVSS